ncbi:MAG: hypothetical protein BGO49_08745 [Planctomycetales bacterium 71-10]|nr:MAG: hypothetical protein BGO49_08745 [Planctomycetales bacterium 71-10]
MRTRPAFLAPSLLLALVAGCGPQSGPVAPPPPADAAPAADGPNREWQGKRKVGDAVRKAHRALN